MATISRDELDEFFRYTGGRIFGVTFIKKDNSTRNMVCRKGVHAFQKGGENKVAKNNPNLSIVFDMQAHDYRMVNKDTVTKIRFKQKEFEVEDR